MNSGRKCSNLAAQKGGHFVIGCDSRKKEGVDLFFYDPQGKQISTHYLTSDKHYANHLVSDSKDRFIFGGAADGRLIFFSNSGIKLKTIQAASMIIDLDFFPSGEIALAIGDRLDPTEKITPIYFVTMTAEGEEISRMKTGDFPSRYQILITPPSAINDDRTFAPTHIWHHSSECSIEEGKCFSKIYLFDSTGKAHFNKVDPGYSPGHHPVYANGKAYVTWSNFSNSLTDLYGKIDFLNIPFLLN